MLCIIISIAFILALKLADDASPVIDYFSKSEGKNGTLFELYRISKYLPSE